ncbi:AAA family ATPase [Shewanella sp. 4t3-1-2LB]|uniref:ATP-binding protein n=1 Tax=Shewanella sp. 4t3-1-2LB TaxID=2817682 RepID=UPI001A98A8E0|nr:carbon monoxide dehydrogenase accessory protein CooC [Shewanella sp. 4t3-1-2LB]MBO1273490.1 AAA family ATPase [Shewanella sp. 4t3-1-2LB]
MKIAITGKGGVGKTTIAGLLARTLAADGCRVLAIDADPDANLAAAVGIPTDKLAQLQPFSKMKQLAKQRTGADQNNGGLYVLNPRVDDLPDSYCVEHAGVRLLMMGTVEHGGSGCVCPEHTLLRSLMKHLLLERDDVVIMDMEAGIEHLGRATAEAVDVLIVVVEPGKRSLQTSTQIEQLAADIGIKRIAYIASKVVDDTDLHYLQQALPNKTWLGHLSYSARLRDTDKDGSCAFDIPGAYQSQMAAVKTALLQMVNTLQHSIADIRG